MVAASIVVPAYREPSLLPETLDTLTSADAEIIVVAAGVDTAAAAEAHPATDTVLREEQPRGVGAARNRGAEAASGDVVLFTDADTLVPPNWVEKHCSHYADEAVVGVGGPMRPRSDRLKHRVLFRLMSDWWYRLAWRAGFVQVAGVNASYRRAAFIDAGGFDEELPFMEDTELSMRMKEYGAVRYDPGCAVRTAVRRQEGEGYAQLFLRYLRAYVYYYVLDRPLQDRYFPSSAEVSEDDVYGGVMA